MLTLFSPLPLDDPPCCTLRTSPAQVPKDCFFLNWWGFILNWFEESPAGNMQFLLVRGAFLDGLYGVRGVYCREKPRASGWHGQSFCRAWFVCMGRVSEWRVVLDTRLLAGMQGGLLFQGLHVGGVLVARVVGFRTAGFALSGVGWKAPKWGHIDGSEFLVGLVCLHGAGFWMTCCVGHKAFGRDAGWASNYRVCTCGEGAGWQGSAQPGQLPKRSWRRFGRRSWTTRKSLGRSLDQWMARDGGELPTARKWLITPVINGISRVHPLIHL